MGLTFALAILAALGLIAAIRLAPADPGVWHTDPATQVPAQAGWGDASLAPPGTTDGPHPMPGGAYARHVLPDTPPAETLRRLDAAARATPHTTLLAGTPAEGRMTWVTRSALWGFPDYTTAQATAQGNGTRLFLVARLRFGRHDFGVNAARLTDWLTRL